jgi:hypothetical protein
MGIVPASALPLRPFHLHPVEERGRVVHRPVDEGRRPPSALRPESVGPRVGRHDSISSPPRSVTYRAFGSSLAPLAGLALHLLASGLAAASAAAPPVSARGSAADLRLSEVLSLNQTGLTDGTGAHPDWIELRNPGTSAIELAGWSLSDDPHRPRRWTFLDGSVPAGGSLLVFASGDDRQPRPAAPLDPATVPGLATWLRADAIQATDPGQVRVSGTNRYVVRWRDSSGRSHDARQTAANRQPRYLAGAVPALRFDGVDDLLLWAEPAATNDFTVFAVVRPAAGHELDDVSSSGVGGTSGQRWLFGAAHGGDAGAGMGISAGTNGVTVYEHGSGYMPALAAYAGPLADSSFVLSVVYANRQPALAVRGHAPTPGEPSARATVTAPVEIGAGAYGSWPGDLHEVLVYARALDEAERRGIEVALASRHRLRLEAEYHTNFRLAAEGEHLRLTRPDGSTADAWDLPALPRDISWGTAADGGDERFFYFQPTPGAPNRGETATAFLAPPAFSVPAGFHPATLLVSLSAPDPDAEIRYTLDGSEPSAASALYSTPLVLTNRTPQRNGISVIPTAPGWQAPLGQVFKGTVVRARTFRAGSIPSDVVTATYFVDPAGRKRYALPVVSLATAPGNFFDPDVGIYVPGNSPSGNYAQSGDAWERPVHVEFFETNGVRVLAQESGVRIHGNTSFGFPVKALRLHPENQGRHRPLPPPDFSRSPDRLLPPAAPPSVGSRLLPHHDAGRPHAEPGPRDGTRPCRATVRRSCSSTANTGASTTSRKPSRNTTSTPTTPRSTPKPSITSKATPPAPMPTKAIPRPTTRSSGSSKPPRSPNPAPGSRSRPAWRSTTSGTTNSPRSSTTAGTSGTTGSGGPAPPRAGCAGSSSTATSATADSGANPNPGPSTCSRPRSIPPARSTATTTAPRSSCSAPCSSTRPSAGTSSTAPPT